MGMNLRLRLGHAQKAAHRQKYRHTVPKLAAAKFNFLFETAYQSTDESVSESDGAVRALAIDLDSDDNGPVLQNVVNATVPWQHKVSSMAYVTQMPLYRNPEVWKSHYL